jgi:hypothetical protein
MRIAREPNPKLLVCYCPYCCQFGNPAKGVPIEGYTFESKTPIMVCVGCGVVKKPKAHKDLPGQGRLSGC